MNNNNTEIPTEYLLYDLKHNDGILSNSRKVNLKKKSRNRAKSKASKVARRKNRRVKS